MNDNDRILQLRKLLNKYNYEYYVLNNSSVSDYEFDSLLNELIALEKKNPSMKDENSPTNRVGGQVVSSFNKITHKRPMLSLGNAFNFNELISFDKKIKDITKQEKTEYMVELKIDGLAISLDYSNGKINYGSTRGNGVVGEEVTHNIKTIKSIPLNIDDNQPLEVRGEIFMSKSSFNKLNKQKKENNETLFANPRNAASGSIRQLDSKIASLRGLDVFIYTFVNAVEFSITKQSDALNCLDKLGFKTNKERRICQGIDKVIEYIEEYSLKRDILNYEIDGIVVKVNDMNLHELIGYTAKTPKWAIAYKFPASEVKTQLVDIIYSVGRTGKITPNAVLTPVLVAGSIIGRATLHNEDFIKERNIMIGDNVLIRKAGDVIPEVIKSIVEDRDGSQKEFKMIDFCPVCKQNIIRKIGEAAHYCINPNCDARKIEKIIHFASKGAMNIEGLGEKVAEDLYNLGFVNQIDQIYELYNNKEKLSKLEGYGEKSISNLLTSIEKSKSNPVERLIFALGINEIGEKTSKTLASKFLSIDNLISASIEDLLAVKDIGVVSANSLFDFFSKEENIILINKLKEVGVNHENKKKLVDKETIFNNKKVVITGTFKTYKRNQLIALFENLGANVISSVSKNLDFLILGEDPGSKYDKAKELEIKLIKEDELIDLIK